MYARKSLRNFICDRLINFKNYCYIYFQLLGVLFLIQLKYLTLRTETRLYK